VSPGLAMRPRGVPQGWLKITQDAILGNSTSEMDYLGGPTQDHVLGNFQPSLRDSIWRGYAKFKEIHTSWPEAKEFARSMSGHEGVASNYCCRG
jgi:hypothetical protein